MSFLPATANDLPNRLNPAGKSPALAPVWSGVVPGIVLVAMITTVA
ncbi:YeiH family putative sulfate export transporter, partial [Mesorhizobium sp. M1C.F.Ca.ET.176.01.1.1]